MKLIRLSLLVFAFVLGGTAFGQSNLPACQGSDAKRWSNCFGSWTASNGDKYVGEYKDGKRNGQGTYTFANGDKYVGEFKDDNYNGQGTYYFLADNQFKGDKYVGEFKDDAFEGQGVYTFIDGRKWLGEWSNWKFDGRGILYSVNGSIKESGIYKDGKLVTSQYIDPNSFTRITRNNSAPAVSDSQRQAIEQRERQVAIEAGQSKLPACQGSDTKRWSNCTGEETTSEYIYKGEFLNGKQHGAGQMNILHPNFKGDKYVGEFKDDKYNGQGTYTSANGDKYVGELKGGKKNGQGTYIFADGEKYVGEWKDGKYNGQGTYTFTSGDKYVGEYKDDKRNGQGIYYSANGNIKESGIYKDGKLVTSQYIDPNSFTRITRNNSAPAVSDSQRQAIEQRERQIAIEAERLAEERRKLEAQKAQIEQEKKASRIAIKGSASQPDANGDFTITIQTGADTASLKIDGEEVGGKRDGNYVIKRVARVGEQNSYLITARDVFGNTDSATVTVARQVADSRPLIPRLNPASVKVQQSRDAVAIIIGIENYRRVAKADFANADAKEFYTYASRALGIKPENIKLLVDDGADDIEMLNAFQNWLPLKVNKGKTDVYVFYSGHGYPSQDGNSLYFLPFNVDKQYLDRTSVKQKEVVSALQKAQAKSVTMFIDACYSGQTRGGEVLIAGLKPIVAKTDEKAYPAEFTVITASAADQFSSASQDLKHGIFSFYLMKGMEGDADGNKDGRITSGELQKYLSEMVGKQAMGLNRTQNTQLFGDADRVLVGR